MLIYRRTKDSQENTTNLDKCIYIYTRLSLRVSSKVHRDSKAFLLLIGTRGLVAEFENTDVCAPLSYLFPYQPEKDHILAAPQVLVQY